jgi:hypothetical protein
MRGRAVYHCIKKKNKHLIQRVFEDTPVPLHVITRSKTTWKTSEALRDCSLNGQPETFNPAAIPSSAGSRLAQREHPKNLLGAVVGDAGAEGLITLVTAEREQRRVPRSGIVRPGRERRDEIDPTR